MKYSSLFLAFFVVVVFIQLNCYSQKSDTVYVSSFGVEPNSYTNCVKNLIQAIEECKTKANPVLVFKNGRYDFYQEGAIRAEYYISNTSTQEECPSKIKTIGILLKNINNLTIEGNGSLFMFHGKMITLLADNCVNLKLKNFHCDFERPTMSEMQVTALTNYYAEVTINPSAWYEIKNGTLNWYGEDWKAVHFHCIRYVPETGSSYYSSWDNFKTCKAEEVSKNIVRFYGIKNIRVGEIYSIRDALRDQVGMHLLESKNVTIKDVHMHFMHGLGIVAQFCENITYDHLICSPRPETGRMYATTADMAHFTTCSGFIKIENSLFSGAHDDPINIHSAHLRIVRQLPPNKIVVKFMHGQSYGFKIYEVGDSIDFIREKTLLSFDRAVVKSATKLNNYEIELTLDKSLPANIQENDCIENISRTPNVVIRNCRFDSTPTRGILLTTRRKSLIENCVFSHIGMAAILISNDASSWFESGMVRDVTIRNNEFIDCGYNGGPGNRGDAIIAIWPENSVIDKTKPVHRNITIEGNTFRTYDRPVLVAKSTGNLIFRNNTVLKTNTLQPISTNKFTVNLVGCSKVLLANNKYASDLLSKNIVLKNMDRKDILLKGEDETLTVEVTGK